MSLNCPSCHGPMVEHTLDGHLGTAVTIDLCQTCQALWFDARESLQLTPGSTLRLFREIGGTGGPGDGGTAGDGAKGPGGQGTKGTGATVPGGQGARGPRQEGAEALEGQCPRCSMRLKPVHDMQRTTKFQYLRCPAGHGRLISFVDFLREKNFLKPLSADQLENLRRNVQTVNCSNCGAPIDLAKTSSCTHCGSPLSMIDFKQAQALIDQLREADAGKDAVDPALPMNLLRARRDVAASFDALEKSPAWFDDVSTSGGLVQAGIKTLQRWLQ